MRAVGKIVAGTAGILFALPAAAAITHDQAFELCIEQPALQVDNLQSIVEEQLSRPHPSVWDSMTMPQIVNAFQYYQGNICADQLMDHQDTFAVIGPVSP